MNDEDKWRFPFGTYINPRRPIPTGLLAPQTVPDTSPMIGLTQASSFGGSPSYEPVLALFVPTWDTDAVALPSAVTNALGNRVTAAYQVPAVTTPTVSIDLNELLSTH